MGHDVIPIGHHSLNTSSIQSLAEDLSNRFDAEIIFGYQDDWVGNNYNGSFEFIELGRIEKKGKAVFLLQDCFYMDRLKQPGKHEQKIWYEFISKKKPDNYQVSIYKNCFDCNCHFDSRWWNFCRYFNRQINNAEWDEYIAEFRKEIATEVKKLGGTSALYGDDQGASHWISEMGIEHSFEEIREKLKEDFGGLYLSVSNFIKSADKTANQLFYNAYFDDFSDLI